MYLSRGYCRKEVLEIIKTIKSRLPSEIVDSSGFELNGSKYEFQDLMMSRYGDSYLAYPKDIIEEKIERVINLFFLLWKMKI